MQWYEWIFDGVGTALIGLVSGVISYKAAVRKMSSQKQTARDDAIQKQETIIENTGETRNNEQRSISQSQKAGVNAKQTQIGRFINGE